MKYLVLFILLPFVAFSQNKPALPSGRPASPIGRGASPLETKAAHSPSGSTYAVVVGISDYQDPGITDLRFADKDAEAFANYLRSPAGGKLDNDQIHLGLVYTPYKRYSGLAVENKKVMQRNTINIIAYNNLSCSLKFGNKPNEALNYVYND